MVSRKRKVPTQSGSESDSSGYSLVQAVSDDEIDISSALTARTPKNTGKQKEIEGDDSDDDLHEMIRASISKRNVKGGTELLKKTKGKTKVTKGEVGGGSFQSMGTCIKAYLLKA
jgi:ATP-dependent RNA helicase DDX54/DBP10